MATGPDYHRSSQIICYLRFFVTAQNSASIAKNNTSKAKHILRVRSWPKATAVLRIQITKILLTNIRYATADRTTNKYTKTFVDTNYWHTINFQVFLFS